jgi:hypothetical protein
MQWVEIATTQRPFPCKQTAAYCRCGNGPQNIPSARLRSFWSPQGLFGTGKPNSPLPQQPHITVSPCILTRVYLWLPGRWPPAPLRHLLLLKYVRLAVQQPGEIRGMPLHGKFGNGAIFLAPAEQNFSSSCCHSGMATAAWLLRIPPANDTKHESALFPSPVSPFLFCLFCLSAAAVRRFSYVARSVSPPLVSCSAKPAVRAHLLRAAQDQTPRSSLAPRSPVPSPLLTPRRPPPLPGRELPLASKAVIDEPTACIATNHNMPLFPVV